ncbi:MAG: molybdopterin-guanine dinucleotide biosynthesis protein B [Gemmatimonadota bacterium]|nr:molybdopterin-guanine dinucleotide biosynthesis protein B [Gemmatimonadota bacterium]MDH4347651.1 molybdopterin-guanine dinucleotide biosynthesis protein B [Gemmatimonadota bacterium]MDH5282432.1 molybdopterin-guanine dinucleotide biosynthesis protein B [Gemmatimonadota bacterium]
MADTRIVSVVGRKDAGKTTLVVALAGEFTRKGRRVMTIKHASHPVDVDRPGTDSYRHFHEGKAERTLVVSPEMRVSFERHRDDADPVDLAAQYCGGADVVLVEGFRRSTLPKIEVFRRAASDAPLYDPGLLNAQSWIAIVTDDDRFQAPCPVLRFRDTMWLQLLANLAWDRATILPAKP